MAKAGAEFRRMAAVSKKQQNVYANQSRSMKKVGQAAKRAWKKGMKKKKGCYVATAVYDSYNCPEVWALRRFRDYTLDETWYGRAFIKMYYAISPSMVHLCGDTKIFKSLWRKPLDRLVEKLIASGVQDTPYIDKY